MAKVSVCIPAYNNREGVERLLQSLEKQSYTDYEAVITDDSDDESIGRLAKMFRNVVYYKNQKRLGSTANWNAAVEKSSGEYIKMMHHDDWLTDQESLSAFAALLEEHPLAALGFSGSRQVDLGSWIDRKISKEDVDLLNRDYRNLFIGNTIGAPSAVIYRRGSRKFDENLKWLVDMEFYMGLLSGGDFCYTGKPLVSIGISSAQLTQECRDDGLLNAKEYGYIYDRYALGGVPAYRAKLIRVLADAKRPYEEARKHQISRREYEGMRLRKLSEKVKWKLGIGREELT